MDLCIHFLYLSIAIFHVTFQSNMCIMYAYCLSPYTQGSFRMNTQQFNQQSNLYSKTQK